MKSMFSSHFSHYYGDTVRRLFLLIAVIMIVSLPLLNEALPVPTIVSVMVIVGINLLAGIANPVKHWPAAINASASAIGLIIFEYNAVLSFNSFIFDSNLFWVNQIIAIIFFVALYFSTKTLRSMLIG